MEEICKNYITEGVCGFVQANPYLWFLVVLILIVIVVVRFVLHILGLWDSAKSRLLMPAAKKWNFRQLTKSAEESDIKGNVNRELQLIKKYLPAGWIRKMEIEWVESTTKEDLLNEGDAVLRMRPAEDQALNFVNATYYFLKKRFFPKVKNVIPPAHYEASVLYLCRNIINRRGGDIKNVFEDNILEPAVQKHNKLLSHIEDYEEIDARGFFTGTFLREVDAIANDVKFTSSRGSVGREAKEIIKHIQGFLKAYDDGSMIPSAGWYRKGPVSGYSFLLVADPTKTKDGTRVYINRAIEQASEGSDRLYVFGAEEEKKFTLQVVEDIKRDVYRYKLVEVFKTPFDYRADKGGVGALFILRNQQE